MAKKGHNVLLIDLDHQCNLTQYYNIYESKNIIANAFKGGNVDIKKIKENISRAKEILETMDMMREVVLQNAQLNKEIAALKVENKELMQLQAQDLAKLKSTISKFSSKLAAFEDYKESEEIQRVLKRI